jgi:hypothetical protein
VAIAVLANATTGASLANTVTRAVLDHYDVRPAHSVRHAPLDPEQCVGSYERGHARFTVTSELNGNLRVAVAPGPLGDQDPKGGAGGTYVRGEDGWFSGPGGRISFIAPNPAGQFTYFHDGRAARRVT